MDLKKSKNANLEDKKLTFLLLGLVFALGISFIALEWTKTEVTKYEVADEEFLVEEEIEIMRCIASGDSNTVIAKKFKISPNTVKTRVAKLTEKLNAQDRIQVAVIAAKCNLI